MRRSTRARDFTIVALLLVTLLAGCAAPWPFPQPTPDTRLPDSQQIFRPLETGPNAGDVYTLDPAQIIFSTDYQLAQLIYPQLVTLDDQQRVVDWAAERHEVSADGLTYTFHLRKGMTWSDGTPIDANTFAYSINRALDPCTYADGAYADGAYDLYPIKGAAAFNGVVCPHGATESAMSLIGSSLLVSDPLTLQIKLERPAGYFLAALTYPASWGVPKSLIERHTDAYIPWTYYLTENGPFGGNLFTLVDWRRQASSPDGLGHLTFERNPRFWGKKPLLLRIEYTLHKYPDVAWNAYKQGSGDASSPYVQDIDYAKILPGSTYHEIPQLTTAYLQPNWQKAPFDDARVRQAFSLAIDRQALTKSVTTQPTQITFRLAQPTIHLLIDGLPGYNANLRDPAGRTGAQALTADLTTARALVAAYAAEKCGGRVERCTPISYFSVPFRPDITQRADALIAQWQAAFPGWPINKSVCDRGCPPYFDASRHQLFNAGWGADYPDGQEFLSLLWRTGAMYNKTGVSVSAADPLLDQADASNDQALRTRLYPQAEQLLVNQVAAIPLFQYQLAYVVRSRVAGWSVASIGVTPLSVWQETYLTR